MKYEKNIIKNKEENIVKNKVELNKIEENKIEQDKIIENKEENINKKNEEKIIDNYHYLNLSEINSKFYEKINSSRKLESLRKCLRKINKEYINKIPSLFFKYINDNIKFNNYQNGLRNILNVHLSNSKLIYEKLKNQYIKEKNNNIAHISIYEISDSDFFFEKKQINKIKIINYKKEKINKEKDKIDVFEKNFKNWIDDNSKSYDLINLIILNFNKGNRYIVRVFYHTDKLENRKNFTLCYKSELSEIIKSLDSSDGLEFNDVQDILNEDIIKIKVKNQFMKKKLNLFINYVDKLLRNKIIVNEVNNINKNNKYLEELAIKINQELAIYYNYDICKYNENVIDLTKLKNLIFNIYSNIDVKKFQVDLINKILKILNNKLSFIKEYDFVLQNKIIDLYQTKFSKAQFIFENLFYKYFIKKYYSLKKVKKNIIIDNFLDKFNDDKSY